MNAPACPYCRKPIAGAAKLLGRKVQCAKCGGKYRMPSAAGGKIEKIFDLDESVKPRRPADASAETSVPTREMPAVGPGESPDEASSKVRPVPVRRRRGPLRNRSGVRERIKLPAPAGAEGNRVTGRPEIFAGLGLIVAFFLPWYSALGRSANGHELAKVLSLLGDMGATEAGVIGGLLYMIPAGGVVGLVLTLAMPRRSPIGPLLGGGLALLGMGYFMSKVGGDVFSNASVGFYMTLLSIAALLTLPFVKFGRK